MSSSELVREAAIRLGGVVLDASEKIVLLDDPGTCYLVVAGGADLFLTSVQQGAAVGAKSHVGYFGCGQMMMGLPAESSDDKMFCFVPGPDSEVYCLARSAMLSSCDGETISPEVLLKNWFTTLVAEYKVTVPALTEVTMGEIEEYETSDERVYVNRSQDLYFVEILNGAVQHVYDLTLESGDLMVFASDGWFFGSEGARVKILGEKHLERLLQDRDILDALNGKLLHAFVQRKKRQLKSENERLKQQQTNQSLQLGNGLRVLTRIFSRSGSGNYSTDEAPLILACRIVADKEGIQFREPVGNDNGTPLTLRDIEFQNVFRSREVFLRGEWWKNDHGTLLAFHAEDDRPVALVQDGPNKYLAFDSLVGDFVHVGEEYAAELKTVAHFFYRPMEDKALSIRELLKFGMRNSKRDMWMTLFISLLGALLGMLTPVAMSLLIDDIIPEANLNQLYFIGAGLVAIAFADAMFEITRGIAMQRFQGKNGMAIQTAVWDRLLALPVPFFQQYSAGELSTRANGVSSIMNILSGTTSTALISGVFSIFYFILLFYYDSKLAWIAAGLALLTIVATLIVNYIKLGYMRKETKLSNELAGLVLQLLESVSKLRNTGAEARAFFQWSAVFAEQRPQVYKAENVSNYLETYNSVLPVLSSILIFWAVIHYGATDDKQISIGQFVAFNVAYGSFLSGMLGLTEAAMSLMAVIPIYENSKPVLQAIPERSIDRQQAPTLSGKIEVSNLSFRYEEDGPDILKSIDLEVSPGEYVALVGSSGSGKSTLLRLLLGFETPSSGNVFYDDIDIDRLEIASLRRQLGVVLQNGSLLMGDIFKNIVGSSPLTEDDAWEAARLCGLKDDIEAMPMGLHTNVSSGVLSGGQIQRLMIARAIVHKPNILYFDEATSALDNRTQAIVTESLEQLRVTRIVIAHRLSTIVKANRILYLHEGKIVEDGTYDELMKLDGFFAELARRQKL
ncbi:hypothetical protein A3709_12050 [Halioglobus sp. HI00S01]|uniref:NHLP bacteriocin export ABC transporter permease/ATPase subunit n=1 Tax=Halioglobus sp. HI00S01 TaxID=1822214 RepID=UPI0007C3D551|nr:NHLP bacteriocin export ABC transporter permease/ATPase subunit [Halioglobus sp. HI00S01]KZX60316.1 hypothetical protein A3709_12050 [Halioglobus sp. HI00S01]